MEISVALNAYVRHKSSSDFHHWLRDTPERVKKNLLKNNLKNISFFLSVDVQP
jgi:hypothetical protein